MKSEQIKEITDRATEQLVASLNAGRSEALTGYLKAIGRLHRYSLHNVLLIASQKPNASYVAGFRTWNQLGRFVKKGEKGILILAPIVRRKLENEEDREEASTSVAGFRAAYVFDAGGVADEWVTQLLRQSDAQVFKKYSQMKLQMKREALEKLNRRANEIAPVAADVLLAAPMCTVALQ